MSTHGIAQFEKHVLTLALRGDSEWRTKLRAQIPHLRVKSRRVTGAGFFTDFVVASDAMPALIPSTVAPSEYPPTVNARRTLPTEGLASFIVWVGAEGYIRQLEACSLTDAQWPSDPFAGFCDFQNDVGDLIE